MKVIHLISGGDTGGAKTHIHYLLSGISENIDVTLVCFSEGDFSREAIELKIPTVVMNDRNIFKTISRLIHMIKDEGYDIIHSHGAKGNLIASLIRRSCELPVVTTIHSDPKLDYLDRPLARLIYGSLNQYAIHRSDYLVGVSDSMRDLLVERGFNPNRVFTIYNGVDFSVDKINIDRKAYFDSYGFKVEENSVIVGIAARLDPVKDVATLLLGFAEAARSCPQLRLVIAGDGGETEILKNLAEELGIQEKVCFIGWTNDVNSFYSVLDINTLTSISETFPYALTEGARAGLATIASRVGGVPMLIRDGETGFLFEAGDHEQLAKKLVLLAEDEKLRKRLGEAIYQKAKEDFSVEATTKRQLDIYTEVLRRDEIKRRNGRDGIIICGAYGMGNAGDNAILEAIVNEMRSRQPFIPITTLSRQPKKTSRDFAVRCLHTFNIPGFHHVAKHTKLYLSGGGSLIQNVTSRRSLLYYLYTIKTAKRLGNHVMMYGCGIGPVNGKADIKKVRNVLNSCVDVITLREKFSMEELSRFGVTGPKILVASDPALTLSPASSDRVDEEMAEYTLNPGGKYVCFSVRKWPGFKTKAPVFAAAADFVYDKLGHEPVFMLINRKEDTAVTEAVLSLMKFPAKIISEPMDPKLTIGLMGRMRTVVSMRLHGLIFAASRGVPLVGISYDPKVSAFLASIGESLCITYDELNETELLKMIEKAVTAYDDNQQRSETVESLVAAEKLNAEYAWELLNKAEH